MLNRYARAFFTKLLSPVAAVLVRLGISPDVVTAVSYTHLTLPTSDLV